MQRASPMHASHSIFLGGLLTLDSDWTPPLGDALIEVLEKGQMGHLDLGCVAAHGMLRVTRMEKDP